MTWDSVALAVGIPSAFVFALCLAAIVVPDRLIDWIERVVFDEDE